MKRYGDLFNSIVSWDNLLYAARLTGRSKPITAERAHFEFNMERELVRLRNELKNGCYRPGRYRTFTIYDPKKRLISAASYRDRVVHHCLCAVIEPLFDRMFLPQNYANRKGRGLHKGIRMASRIVNRYKYVFKADIVRYFPSIDHEILKEKIRRKIKCKKTLALIDQIVDNSNKQEPVCHHFPGDSIFTPLQRNHGLPIGNLTSQLFANIYLDGLDHFIVHQLRKKFYVRYVDDFLVGGIDKHELHDTRQAIEVFLQGVRLKLHRDKSVVFPVKRGLTFLGFRLYPGRVLAGKRCGRRFVARLKQLQQEYAEGTVDLKTIKQVVSSYNGHLKHGATEKLRATILWEHPFVKGS